MAARRIGAIVFDLYGTVVDVGAVAEACRDVAADPAAFTAQWRAKQLEYSFLRTAMGRYRDFWAVSGEALDFTLRRFGVTADRAQRRRLMEAWLQPTPYPDASEALARLAARFPLAILSNGSPRMLRTGLRRAGLASHFRWVLSVDAVKVYKPSPRVYQLAPRALRVPKERILFVSSNSFDVIGAKAFGFRVCWINRAGAPLDALGMAPDAVVKSFAELEATLA